MKVRNSQNSGTASNSNSSQATKAVTESTADSVTAGTGNKTLIVYYSASGNTKRVANDIADTLNADTFELVKDKVENWNEYSTVFIAYPIWWGIAAWPEICIRRICQ